MASHSRIATIAEAFGLTYQETRAILKEKGIKMRRGRMRGSGRGIELSANGRADRRVSWIANAIEDGRCTSCSKPNDSTSLYHCKACLKTRNDQAKERNKKKKTESSAA
jgi:hypothetical protein